MSSVPPLNRIELDAPSNAPETRKLPVDGPATNGAIYGNRCGGPTAGTDIHSTSGSSDIFVTKINADGTYAWTATMGGSNADEGNAVAVDSTSNVYLTGYSDSLTIDLDPTAHIQI